MRLQPGAEAVNAVARIVLRALAALAILVATAWQGGFGMVAAGDAARPVPAVRPTDVPGADLAVEIGEAGLAPTRAGAPDESAPTPRALPADIPRPIDGPAHRPLHLPAAGLLSHTSGQLGVDSDGDRLPDAAERAFGTDPLNDDVDADGLPDGDEVFRYGTDPRNSDTDGDGLPDGDEVLRFGTNPLGSDTNRDGLGYAEDLTVAPTVRRLWDVVRVDASGARLLPHGGADP